MEIPSSVLKLIDTLESSGFQTWAVGGCVRDSLLGVTPHDWDLCTAATPAEIAGIFQNYPLIRAGEKHGTIAVILEHGPVEITTFRSEGGYADHRRPDWVHFEQQVEADLARRDFTVNAMAYHPARGLCDPFGGQQDLQNHILRAVGDPAARFQEDGLRILRGARFSARFHLQPEPDTYAALCALAPLLAEQARERVFSELCGWILAADAQNLITFAPVMAAAIPDLGACQGFLQHNPHHRYDIYTHIAHVVEGVPPVLPLRWAALLHDVGKPACFMLDDQGIGHFKGHAGVGAVMARQILQSLRSPNALTERVSLLVAYHSTCRQVTEPKSIRRLLRKLGQECLHQLLLLDQADDQGKGTAPNPWLFQDFAARMEQVLLEKPAQSPKDLAINGHQLAMLGVPAGPEMGRMLQRLLDECTDGLLENAPEPLLQRSRELWQQARRPGKVEYS